MVAPISSPMPSSDTRLTRSQNASSTFLPSPACRGGGGAERSEAPPVGARGAVESGFTEVLERAPPALLSCARELTGKRGCLCRRHQGQVFGDIADTSHRLTSRGRPARSG